MYDHFTRVHQTLKTTSAIAGHLTDRKLKIEDVVAVLPENLRPLAQDHDFKRTHYRPPAAWAIGAAVDYNAINSSQPITLKEPTDEQPDQSTGLP